MTEYARTWGPQDAANAQKARGAVPWSPKPASEAQERRNVKILENRAQIFPRLLPSGREVWDVFRLEGGKVVGAYIRDCAWFDEALELAGHYLSGRTTVSMAGARALLAVGAAGGKLAAPIRSVDPRDAPRLKVTTKDGKLPRDSRCVEVERA